MNKTLEKAGIAFPFESVDEVRDLPITGSRSLPVGADEKVMRGLFGKSITYPLPGYAFDVSGNPCMLVASFDGSSVTAFKTGTVPERDFAEFCELASLAIKAASEVCRGKL